MSACLDIADNTVHPYCVFLVGCFTIFSVPTRSAFEMEMDYGELSIWVSASVAFAMLARNTEFLASCY